MSDELTKPGLAKVRDSDPLVAYELPYFGKPYLYTALFAVDSDDFKRIAAAVGWAEEQQGASALRRVHKQALVIESAQAYAAKLDDKANAWAVAPRWCKPVAVVAVVMSCLSLAATLALFLAR